MRSRQTAVLLTGMDASALPVPWSSDSDLKAAVHSGMVNAPPFRRLLSQLVFSEAQVRDHLDDFLTFRLSVEYLEHVFWRITVLAEEAAKPQRTPEAAAALIRTIAERDQRLLEKLNASWNKGRPATRRQGQERCSISVPATSCSTHSSRLRPSQANWRAIRNTSLACWLLQADSGINRSDFGLKRGTGNNVQPRARAAFRAAAFIRPCGFRLAMERTTAG